MTEERTDYCEGVILEEIELEELEEVVAPAILATN
jgi:hypothetical protein